MIRGLSLVVGLLIGGTVLVAQDAVSEVRKAMNDSRAAAAARDAKAYERFVAEDLRWVNTDGTVSSKQDRLKAVTGPGTGPPAFGEMDIKVSGDTATVVLSQTFPNGDRARQARTWVKRDGRWQLLLHAAVPMK